jgi:predicted dehydrogenase
VPHDGPILVAGFGSIGRRHCRNLLALGSRDVVVYRTGLGTLELDPEMAGLPVVSDLDEALDRRPRAVVVSNPTSLHVPVALRAAEAGCDLLIEKPLWHSLDGVKELEDAVARREVQVLMGFQFRFHPVLRQVRALVASGRIGSVVSAHAHWGEYLPSWHPWEPYRTGYSARPDLGGGAILTLSHPLDYLRWIVGEVASVQAMVPDVHPLGLEVEESATMALRFEKGATGGVHVDYLEAPANHWMAIRGDRGTVHWSAGDGVARVEGPDGDAETIAPPGGFERNSMFLAEMEHFLGVIGRREKPVCTLQDGVRALEIALAAKEAARKGREVGVG